ncbi:ABC transporter permease [Patescibacteria group bacterium]|nr:ABC transporter permease [Patescibacteria group bacterium]
MFNRLKPIIRKELAFFFHSPTAYVSLAVFVVIVNWLYFTNFFLVGQVNMRLFFQNIPLVYLFLIPALSMTSYAEEKRTKTIEILFTLPLTKLEIVLGKFAGGMLVVLLGLALTATIPITLTILGQPEWGPIITGYLAAILLGTLYMSAGLLVSSNTDSQIVSFTITAGICFMLYITGAGFFLERLPSYLESIFRYVSALTHFESMAKGVVDLRDLVYFVSLSGLLIYFNVERSK